MQRVLILSDNEERRSKLASDIGRLGYQTYETPDCETAMEFIGSERPKLIVLDMAAPGEQGSRCLRKLEKSREARDIPTILLVAEDTLEGAVPGVGMVDFIVEPIRLDELDIRLKALLKRVSTTHLKEVIRLGDLTIDLAEYEVSLNGDAVYLTLKEFELLRFLATHPDRVYRREELLSQVWGYDYYGGTRTVDVHIRRLRMKLGPVLSDRIRTIRGVGYKFENR